MAVLAEGAAYDRDDIIVLAKLPLFNPDGTPTASALLVGKPLAPNNNRSDGGAGMSAARGRGER